jgi:hypothetical protein
MSFSPRAIVRGFLAASGSDNSPTVMGWLARSCDVELSETGQLQDYLEGIRRSPLADRLLQLHDV